MSRDRLCVRTVSHVVLSRPHSHLAIFGPLGQVVQVEIEGILQGHAFCCQCHLSDAKRRQLHFCYRAFPCSNSRPGDMQGADSGAVSAAVLDGVHVLDAAPARPSGQDAGAPFL